MSLADVHTETWRRACAMWRARLAELREQNDKPLDAAATATLRGQIAEIKTNLALAEEMKTDLAARGNQIAPGDVSADY